MLEGKGVLSFLKKPSLIFLVLIPFLLVVFRFLFDFNGLYGQDAHEYLRYTKAVHDFFRFGKYPGEFQWQVLYPVLGAIFSFIVDPALSLQVISIISFCGTLYFTCRTLVMFYSEGKMVMIYVLLFGSASSYFLRLGVCVMSDMTAIFFTVASLFFTIRFTREKKKTDVLFVFCFSTAAVLTRLPSIIVLLFPLLIFALVWLKDFSLTYFLTAVLLCTIVAIPSFLLRGQGAPDTAARFFNEWSFKNYFLNQYETPGNGFLSYHFPNILFILFTFFHPGYLLIAAPLFFFIRKEDFSGNKFFLVLFPALIYLFFIAGFEHQNIRLNTFIFPLLLVFYFPAFNRCFKKSNHRQILKASFFSLVVGLQVTLFYFAFRQFKMENNLEKKITSFIKEKFKGVPVFTRGMKGALVTYGLEENDLFDISYLDVDCDHRNLVLIQTKKIEEQWKESPEANAWEMVEKNCRVNKIMTFENGWDIYETGK